jgi:hypothetical protein
MKEIASALLKAQRGFAPALKNSNNPFYKSKYVDLASCIDCVIDSLNNNGIMLMQPTHETQSGVLVETLFIHESGEMLSGGKLHVPAAKEDPQGYGSALTYARRYSLMAACGIAPEDDDGNLASKVKATTITPTQGAIDNLPADIVETLREYAAEVVDLVTKQKTSEAYDFLESKNLDADQKTALWEIMKPNSKERAALKAIGEQRRKAA